MNSVTKTALLPLSAGYGLVVHMRNRFYRRGTLRVHDVGAPVISVGNLTTGGTGKTPLVKWIAKQLSESGRRVCVLTRGYGRKSTGRVVVSDGGTILVDVNQAGDEALFLAEELKSNEAVICDADRVAAAQWAIENLKTDAFVLDDAFQHQRIARNLNLVTIDATNPWGNRRLLPAGILREPLNSLCRADCIVITRSDQSDQVEQIQSEIKRISPKIPVFLSYMKLANLRGLNQESDVNQRRVAAFCGIANPDSFFTLLQRAGYELASSRAFRDHQNYSQYTIDRMIADADARGAQALITTAKDAVKVRSLNFALPCYVAEIDIEFDRADEFRELILKAVKN
jgi:tetraacyldisaccharide 4'-kinase